MRTITVTAFARKFGLSRTTLLYYDRIGLLKPAEVSTSGYRLYGQREVERMSRIAAFREAGIPLKSIQAILDGEDPGLLELALEQRLASLNREIAQLRSQQALVIELLQRKSGDSGERQVDVQQWVAMLEEAGVDAAGRLRWHQAFERDAPEAHQTFLQSLGLDEAEISEIRQRSRQKEPPAAPHR
ncbi:MerR family transcriptional regulator [Marinobacterium zhoushanense]|uniref:MerR family transcriptional regulator n=1 Tax=Marinobacterium zhoushanense TaxID=1679163 RepID=A0ABQ1K4Y7_9GAMM|nr:MerR family transcriptional regulator [Marinobacterium zhoushanense]GGB86641.1 MerR family transcriptional regulator [Marinobacterium zhoushanense]